MSQQKLQPSPAEAQALLDKKSGYAPLQLGAEVVRRSKRVYRGVYDFAVQGGAIGAMNLYDPVLGVSKPLILPPNFVITNVLIDVVTSPLSAGAATLAVSSGLVAADLKAATAKAAFVGLLAGIPVSAATAIKVPSNQALPGVIPTLTVAVAALTAGKCNVHLEGFLSE